MCESWQFLLDVVEAMEVLIQCLGEVDMQKMGFVLSKIGEKIVFIAPAKAMQEGKFP